MCAHVCAEAMSLDNIRILSDSTCLAGQWGRFGVKGRCDPDFEWWDGCHRGGTGCSWATCVGEGKTGGLTLRLFPMDDDLQVPPSLPPFLHQTSNE